MSDMTCTAEQLIDDDRTRVTRFTFAPWQQTGWHRHGFDYVITALTDCHMRLEHPDGSVTEAKVPAGAAYRRNEGVEHNVINAGDTDMSFIEVELK
ncbi:cupin domain-containing protein [Nioella aestuarii]|uniref:cupin domain-containing protein n=1 Tax=Nioella aestuarii TaxID=1662864 RepID=UPI003D7F39F2